MKGHLTLRARADPPTFQAIRKLIAQTLLVSGGLGRDALELEVATGEVLANAYQHAYRRIHGPLEIDLTFLMIRKSRSVFTMTATCVSML